MNHFEEIEHSRMLDKKRNALIKELKTINKNIEGQEESCSHILVNLGNRGIFTDYERCLLCGQINEEGYSISSKYCIYAEDYLLNFDISKEKDRNEKFDNIQTLAIGLLKENSNMTDEELTTRLNNLIKESINLRESKKSSQLIKKKY